MTELSLIARKITARNYTFLNKGKHEERSSRKEIQLERMPKYFIVAQTLLFLLAFKFAHANVARLGSSQPPLCQSCFSLDRCQIAQNAKSRQIRSNALKSLCALRIGLNYKCSIALIPVDWSLELSTQMHDVKHLMRATHSMRSIHGIQFRDACKTQRHNQ